MYNALFIAWGTPISGREISAAKVFSEWVELLGGMQSKGTIKSFTPVFAQPHGSDIGGFFLVQGDTAKIEQISQSDELRKATVRAQLIVSNFRVLKAITGDEIGKQMQMFTQNASEFGAK